MVFIILVAVVITDGIIHIDAIIEGFQKVLTIPTVFDKELNDSLMFISNSFTIILVLKDN